MKPPPAEYPIEIDFPEDKERAGAEILPEIERMLREGPDGPSLRACS